MAIGMAIKKKGNKVDNTAQMTIFFVMGIVIIIVFGLMIFLVADTASLKIKAESKKALHTFIETSSVEHYISACLDQVSADAIEKITLQGGIIYDYQGGAMSTVNYVLGENYVNLNISNITLSSENPYSEGNKSKFVNISLGLKITNTSGQYPPYLSSSFQNAPAYPQEAEPYIILPDSFIQRINGFRRWPEPDRSEGLYGEISYPKLCNQFSECYHHSNYNIYNNFNLTTIQSQLEYYIEDKVAECVNISRLKTQRSYNISTGNVTAKVSFSIDSIGVEIDYPVILTWPKGEPVSEILKFQDFKNVRMTKIYELIYSILKYESFDIFFDVQDYKNISRSSQIPCTLRDGTRCFDNQISVNKIENVQNGIDLVVIKDNASILKGKPSLFNFLIENRRPALDYINRHLSDEINMVVFNNKTIVLDPQGYDPDSDVLGYKYEGWRADNYTVFDINCWPPPSGNALDCQGPQISDPHNYWQTSPSFFLTSRNATYETNLSDLGLHTVKLTTWDSNGLEDWQDINILVRDFPSAIANGSNEYDDIGDGNASVEDVYILDASNSYVIINDPFNPSSDTWFLWHENFDPYTTTGTTNAITILPNTPFNIFTIIAEFFKNESFNSGETSRENVMIRLETGLDIGGGNIQYGQGINSIDEIFVDIYQCLPHRSTNYPIPFPYSTHFYSTINNFQAEHVCCSNTSGTWGEIEDSSNECFNISEYSSYKYFFQNTDEWYTGFINDSEGGGVFTNDFASFTTDVIYENDIFLRTFKRNCDGTRGNICQGNADADYDNSFQCYDNMPANQIAKCIGPPPAYFDSTDLTVPSGCKIYDPGDTFKEFNNPLPTHYYPCRNQACYNSTDINVMKGKNGLATNVFAVGTAPGNAIYCTRAFCGGNTENIDTGNCQQTTDTDCYCSSNCNGDSRCDTEDPGYSFTELPGPVPANRYEKGCLMSCGVIGCLPYSFNTTFDPGSSDFGCYGECNSNDQCSIYYSCDSTPGGEDCVDCNDISHEQGLGNLNPGVCEEGCGASSFCDEHSIGYVHELNICDSTCQQTNCQITTGDPLFYDNIPRWTGTDVACDCRNDLDCYSLGYICTVATGICSN